MAPKSQSDFYYLLLDKVSENPVNVPSNLPSDTTASDDKSALNPSPPKGNFFDLSDLADLKITVDEDAKTASVKLTQEQMNRVASVRCALAEFVFEFRDSLNLTCAWRILGNDTAVKADWNAGTFESVFQGEWIAIEGQSIFVALVSESTTIKDGKKIDGSELYTVPIELNGRMCKLLVSCEYPERKFSLVGARPDTNSAVPTGELYGIKEGDIVKPRHFEHNVSLEKLYDLLKELAEKYPELGRVHIIELRKINE